MFNLNYLNANFNLGPIQNNIHEGLQGPILENSASGGQRRFYTDIFEPIVMKTVSAN